MVNRVTLVGRLGADPEIKYLEGGVCVARLRVATSESYQDKDKNWIEQVEWHTVILWRELGQKAEKQLKKGFLVLIEGKIGYRTWRDKNNHEQTTVEITASFVRLLAKTESTTHVDLSQALQPLLPTQPHSPQQDNMPF